MNTKYLIVGGSGFIGSNLVTKLSENENNKVVIIDKNKSDNSKIEYHQIDLHKNQIDLELLMSSYKPDVVVHCAFDDNNLNLNDNLLDSIFLMKYSKQVGVHRFVFVSSTDIFDKSDLTDYPGVTDDPSNPLQITRLAVEGYAKYFFGPNSFIRVSDVFGNTVKNSKSESVLDYMISNKPLEISNKFRSEFFDLIYIDDAVDELIQFITSNDPNKVIIDNKHILSGDDLIDLVKLAKSKFTDKDQIYMYIRVSLNSYKTYPEVDPD